VKPLLVSLLATLAGIAMLGVGIAGVAGAFDSSPDGGSSLDVTNFGPCPSTDPRFRSFATYELTGNGGAGTAIVSCQNSSLEATFLATGMTADVPRTAALWLFDTRDNARLVAASPQELGDDSLILSGQLPASGTEPYRKWVVTAEPAGQEAPALPTGAVLAQAAL
jgi:hypothetical protein